MSTEDVDAGKQRLALMALCIARRLGNPWPSLWRTLRSSEQLLSAATALPDTEPDPFAALRRLLQANPASTRTSRRERSAAQPATAVRPAARASVDHSTREPEPIDAAHAQRSLESQSAARRANESPRALSTPDSNVLARIASATADSRAHRALAHHRLGNEPLTGTQPTEPTARKVPAAQPDHALPAHDSLAMRRRRLRDGLQTRAIDAATGHASRGAPALTTAGSLVPTAQGSPSSMPPASEHVVGNRPATLRASDIQPAHAATAATSDAPAAKPAAEPSRTLAPSPITRVRSAVRRLLPSRAAMATPTDEPPGALLDAAHRHGVDLT